jgi:hypothetical protein
LGHETFEGSYDRALVQGARAAVRDVLAVGSNYDGDAEALIHLDGLVKRPTIVVVNRKGEEKTMMADGRLVWD